MEKMRILRFKKQTNIFIFTLITITIVVLLYIIVSRHHIRFDLTGSKKHSLSSQTIKILKDLNKEIKINAFYKEGSFEQSQVKDLLTEYTYKTNKIKLSFVDPDKKPSLATQYGIKEYDVVVFESGNQRKDVTKTEVFEYSYDYYMQGGGNRKFKGEEAFTSAILRVTQLEKKNIFFLEGHEEKDIENSERNGYKAIKESLEKENYNVGKLNLLIEPNKIKECEVLVIAGAKKPLSDKEWEYIKEFLEEAGKIFFLLDPLDCLGIEEKLLPLGIKLQNDIVIDQGRNYFFDALTPIPLYESHQITKELKESRTALILPWVRSIDKKDPLPEKIKIDRLLITSTKSWAETDLTTKRVQFNEGKDLKGPISIAIAWSKEVKGKKEARIVSIGDSDFVTNASFAIQGNKDFFINSINWLVKEEKKISIRPKEEEIKKILLSRQQSRFIFLGTTVIMPLCILFIGGIIWFKQRNL